MPTNAEYMREYRRRKKAERLGVNVETIEDDGDHLECDRRIGELEDQVRSLTEEVERLKATTSETARTLSRIVDPSFGHSRPAPKPGKK